MSKRGRLVTASWTLLLLLLLLLLLYTLFF